MKSFVILICVLALAVAKYTDEYDSINLDEILSNEHLLKNYFNCIMDQGPCPPEGQVLKGGRVFAVLDDDQPWSRVCRHNIPLCCVPALLTRFHSLLREQQRICSTFDNLKEAIATDCKECTDTQKTKSKQGITYIHDNKPEMFKQLTEKFDPTGEYTKKYFP